MIVIIAYDISEILKEAVLSSSIELEKDFSGKIHWYNQTL